MTMYRNLEAVGTLFVNLAGHFLDESVDVKIVFYRVYFRIHETWHQTPTAAYGLAKEQ